MDVRDADGSEDGLDGTGRSVWLGATGLAATYQGPPGIIEVTVTGDRKGELSLHHIVLVDGSVPTFAAGAAPARPVASLELSRKEAQVLLDGRLVPVVGYMRGTIKTKGATRPLYEFFRSLA